MKLMIRDKIVSLSAVACLLPIVVMILMIAIQKNGAQQQVGEEVDKLARDEVAQISEDVLLMCEALNEMVEPDNPENVQKAQQLAHDKIASITVGKSGYVFVLGGKGDDKGHYIVSKDGIRDGENIWNAKDSDNRLFIQSIVNKATLLQPGQIDYERYPWKNKGETKSRYKLSALTYYEPWDWVIGAGTYEDDYYAAKEKISSALNNLLVGSIVGGVILVIISIVVALYLSKRIANPIIKIRDIAREIAQGNFTTEIDIVNDDEVGELADAFREMSENLSEKAKIAENFAVGNLNIDIEVLHAEDALSKSMISVRESLILLTNEVSDLSKAAIRGDLHIRADAEKYHGEYRRIVNGLNSTIDTIVKHLDAVPTPIVILDTQYQVKFMNRAACELGENVTFDNLYNSKCYDFFKTDDCKTGNCACTRAMKSNELVRGSTQANPNGSKMDISYIGTPILDEDGIVSGAVE
ncbi:Cache 3/Cache 2 fusion domain-containing protein, partial [bacterium]|nr:Cache 3/Cache 2 fusion domain-containing protein [bacterium]